MVVVGGYDGEGEEVASEAVDVHEGYGEKGEQGYFASEEVGEDDEQDASIGIVHIKVGGETADGSTNHDDCNKGHGFVEVVPIGYWADSLEGMNDLQGDQSQGEGEEHVEGTVVVEQPPRHLRDKRKGHEGKEVTPLGVRVDIALDQQKGKESGRR